MPAGKFKCLMVRKMRSDVKQSIFATMKKIIKMWSLEPYFRIMEGEHVIICKLNGNLFLPKGMYETGGKSGTAKSIENPTDAIIDEADELTLNEYIKLTGSLRGSNKIEEILIMNPPTDDHWIVKRWFPPLEQFELADGSHTYVKSIIPSATILHTTFLNNNKLTEKEREFFSILEDTNPDLYLTDGLGLLKATKTGGEALKKFDKTIHVTNEDMFDPEKRVLEAWDFNRRPHHTVGLYQFSFDIPANIFYIDLFDELTIEEASVREVQREINTKLKERNYQPKTVRLIGDHSGTKQMDVDIDTHMAKIQREIIRGGYDVLNETLPNPRVVSSLEFLNDIFGGYIFLADQSNFPGVKIMFRVNAKCKFHIADFAKTKTDKEGKLLKMEESKIIKDGESQKKVTYQVRGHGVDVARYMAVGVFEEEYRLYKKKEVI